MEREILSEIESIRAERYQAPAFALAKIMAKIEEEPLPSRRSFQLPNFWLRSRFLQAALTTAAVVMVAIFTVKQEIIEGPLQFNANQKLVDGSHSGDVLVPLNEDKDSQIIVPQTVGTQAAVPPSSFSSKPNTQEVTISIDAVSGVDSMAVPGSQVAVILGSVDKKGNHQSSILVPQAEIVAISQAGNALTLNVSPQDALKLKAAKEQGTTSVMLRPSPSSSSASSVDNIAESYTRKLRRDPGQSQSLGQIHVGGRSYHVLPDGGLAELAPSEAGKSAYSSYYHPYYYPTPYTNTESYGVYQENPRISVATEALSTFSIDVDTGSYANVRRFLRDGQLPPPDAVRIEELLNYFDYDLPLEQGKPFTVSYELAPSPLDPGRHILKLGVRTREPLQNTDAGWNLVFLIDVSGSMADPNKLSLVKEALRLLVGKMRSQDRISIVTYADQAVVALAPSGIEQRSSILSVIDSLIAAGSTNGAAGIERAYALAQANRISSGVNRVILATDGDFNVGVTYFPQILSMVEAKRQGGVSLTTLGFGTGNYKEQTLEQLADKGNGNYHYIDSFSEAAKVFGTDLAANMDTVAKDVKVQIEFNPKHVIEYRLIGYDNRTLSKSDFHNPGVDAGEIGAGHETTALYELLLAGSDYTPGIVDYRYQKPVAAPRVEPVQEFASELAFLKVRYIDPKENASQLLTFPVANKITERSSDDFRFAAAVSYFGHILRNSQYRGNYSFGDISRLAADALGGKPARNEFLDLVRMAGNIRP